MRALTEEVEVGRIYTGTVRRLVDFGAFVEILPGKEGLVRTSQLADYQVMRPEDVGFSAALRPQIGGQWLRRSPRPPLRQAR